MVADTIALQPNGADAQNVMVCAYRQIRFIVAADSIVPFTQPMYADVYFATAFIDTFDTANYTFYKTLTAYSIENSGGKSLFLFDIQDACQEYLTTYIPGVSAFFPLSTDSSKPFSNVNCVVYFRGSTITSGILVPEPTVPTQATATTAAVSPFSGLAAYYFIVFNASIDPEFANIYSNAYENFIAQFRVTTPLMISDTRSYPLSTLPMNIFGTPSTHPDPVLCPSNYLKYPGFFPFVIAEFGTFGMASRLTRNVKVKFLHRTEAGPTTSIDIISSFPMHVGTYYLPVGIDSLKPLVDAVDPTIIPTIINPDDPYYYRLELFDLDASSAVFVTPLYAAHNSAAESECLWFQNSQGHFETVTFVRMEEDYVTKSSQLLTPYTQAVGIGLNDPLAVGIKRYNTRSNNEISVRALFQEELMHWLKELISSPYILRYLANGGSYPFEAVVIMDGTFKTKKTLTEAGVKYDVTMKLRPAIDPIQLRN